MGELDDIAGTFADSEIDLGEESSTKRETPCRFVTGSAGCGKTFRVKKLVEDDPTFGILTASTGIAAVNLNSVTINSVLTYFDTDSLRDSYIRGSLQAVIHKLAQAGYRNIILDECSMTPKEQLDTIHAAVSEVNNYSSMANREPIGLILVGDLCQLPPVKADWIFKADVWPRFAESTERLTKIWRQDNPRFLDALNLLRAGKGGEGGEILQTLTRFMPATDNRFDGTTILAKNDEVDRFNQVRLQMVKGRPVVVPSRRWGKQAGEWRKNIPEQLVLKIGAYVMILSNAKVDSVGDSFAYVNGDTGTIEDFDGHSFAIKLVRNGEIVRISKIHRTVVQREPPDDSPQGPWADAAIPPPFGVVSHDAERELWHCGGCEFYPLRLAWASTVHKSQGLSLERTQIDYRSHFCGQPAMCYVATSRVRSPEGLRIVGSLDVLRRRCNIDESVLPWL